MTRTTPPSRRHHRHGDTTDRHSGSRPAASSHRATAPPSLLWPGTTATRLRPIPVMAPPPVRWVGAAATPHGYGAPCILYTRALLIVGALRAIVRVRCRVYSVIVTLRSRRAPAFNSITPVASLSLPQTLLVFSRSRRLRSGTRSPSTVYIGRPPSSIFFFFLSAFLFPI